MSELKTLETIVATEVGKVEEILGAELKAAEAEAVTIEKEVVAAVENDVIAPVEKIEQEVVAEVKKVVAAVETYFHPEQASKPVINTTVLTSQIKNPA